MSPGRGREGGRWRGVSASARVYRTLIRAYPEDLRRGYGEEMVRCFRDLCEEENESRGASGLAVLWVRTLLELALTVFKERSNMIAKNPAGNAYLPVSPSAAARSGGFLALLGGSLGAAYGLLGGMLPVEAWSGMDPVLEFFSMLIFDAVMLLCLLGLFGLYGALMTRPCRPGRLASMGAALAALAIGSWLAGSGYTAAKELASGSGSALYSAWENHLLGALGAAHLLGWIFGLLVLGVAAARPGLPGRLRVLPLAVATLLVVGFGVAAVLGRIGYGLNGYGIDNLFLRALSTTASTLPFLGSALLGWALLRSNPAVVRTERLAVAGGAAGTRKIARRVVGTMPRVVGGSRTTRTDAPTEEAAKEKELLLAIRRKGRITVTGAALETSLSVEEADRMLSVLATKGHLDVQVERGRVLYSLWEGDV